MAKYDEEFKQRVVYAHLAGEGGYASLAKRFEVRSKTNIRKWVSAFKQFGKQGLLNKKANTTYSVQFKLDVLNYKLITGASFEEVDLKFGIHEPPMISNWLAKWQMEGIEGLSKPKGRPPLSNKPKKINTTKKLTREQQLEDRPNAKAILDALDEAIEISKVCPYRRTIHSDQGWRYQMKAFSKKLKDNNIFQSMSRRGNCLDNSPMENFFSLMKQEMYHGEIYHSFEELNKAITEYIFYYNNERIKEKLTGMSPVEYRRQTSQLAA